MAPASRTERNSSSRAVMTRMIAFAPCGMARASRQKSAAVMSTSGSSTMSSAGDSCRTTSSAPTPLSATTDSCLRAPSTLVTMVRDSAPTPTSSAFMMGPLHHNYHVPSSEDQAWCEFPPGRFADRRLSPNGLLPRARPHKSAAVGAWRGVTERTRFRAMWRKVRIVCQPSLVGVLPWLSRGFPSFPGGAAQAAWAAGAPAARATHPSSLRCSALGVASCLFLHEMGEATKS